MTMRKIIIALALALSACAGNCPPPPAPVTVTKTVDTGCQWAQPVYVHPGDTLSDATADEILEHNKTGAKRCGWKPTGSR